MMQTASTAGLTSLYHYQKFNLGRLLPLFEQRRLYLSRPSGFNDPWDCRPFYDLGALDNRSYRKKVIDFYVNSHRKAYGWSNHRYRQIAAELRGNRPKLKGLVQKMSSIDVDIDRRYRIYCLALRPNIPLMWSHYAEGHSGICLEFSTQSPIMGDALQVTYRETYPSFDVADDSDFVLSTLLTKSADWSYEAEYRFIAQERNEAVGIRTHFTDNSFLSLPTGSLKSVIVGCLMSSANKIQLRDLIKRTDPNVVLCEANKVPDKYQITIRQLQS